MPGDSVIIERFVVTSNGSMTEYIPEKVQSIEDGALVVRDQGYSVETGLSCGHPFAPKIIKEMPSYLLFKAIAT